MRWDLVLERYSTNRLNAENCRKKLRHIASVAERNKSLGFVARVGKLAEPERVTDETTHEEVWRYLVRLRVVKDAVRSEAAAQSQYQHVLALLTRRARAGGWELVGELGLAKSADGGGPPRPGREPFRPPELTGAALAGVFTGIYERDAHIRVLHGAVTSFAESLLRYGADPSAEVARSHVLLKGKPAGCKTKLLERFKTWYERGQDVERVLFVDGPTMSKAGLENLLLDRAESRTLPEILAVEEVEKQDPNNLLTLVSLMGSGYVAKLNARVGHRRELANVLVLATCNDEDVIKNFRHGVLWSRFAHKLHCTRPSRALMRTILGDKVREGGGDVRWVDLVDEFAYETCPALAGRTMTDPREVIALLDGRGRLLDGSHQRDLLSIFRSEADEAAADQRPAAGP